MKHPSAARDSSPNAVQPDEPRMSPRSVMQEPRGRLNAHLANLILIALVVGLSVTWWRELPERIPVHFDFSGNVDRWGSKGTMWWAFAGLAVVGTALMYGVAGLSRRYPQLLNLPRKIRLTSLPPDLREQVISLSQSMIYWLAVAMNLTWLLLLAAVRQAALGAPDKAARLVLATVGIAVIVVLVVLVKFYVRLGRLAKGTAAPPTHQ